MTADGRAQRLPKGLLSMALAVGLVVLLAASAA